MSNEHANPNADSVEVIINAQQFTVPKGEISHDAVVRLAFTDPSTDINAYTVTYDRGESDQHSGVLPPGGTVKVKKDMIFNVTATGMS